MNTSGAFGRLVCHPACPAWQMSSATWLANFPSEPRRRSPFSSKAGNTICLALDRAYKNGAHIDMDLRQLAKSLREELRPQRGNASSKRIETHTVERNVAGGKVPPQSANAAHGITKSASSASTSPNIGNLSDGRVVFRDESGVTRKAEDTKFSPGHDVAVKSDPRGLTKVYRNLVHPAIKRTQRSLQAFDFGGNDFCAGASLWKF